MADKKEKMIVLKYVDERTCAQIYRATLYSEYRLSFYEAAHVPEDFIVGNIENSLRKHVALIDGAEVIEIQGSICPCCGRPLIDRR